MKELNYTMANGKLPNKNIIEIIDPSTNKPFATVPALSIEDIDYVYSKAHATQKGWSHLTISERAKYLRTWGKLILDNKDELSDMLVLEIAKSKADSVIEVERSSEYIDYTIEQMYRIDVSAKSSEQYYGHSDNKLAITKRVPLGVVLAISPFNYPINLAISKIAPALISGNTVVFKPATQGSAVAILLYKLWQQTGAPEGVLNLVTGRGSEIGDYLVTCNQADMVSFTGGTNVGMNISKHLTMTPHVLELGGKDATIILDEDNLDLDKITSDIVSGAFSYSGQRCTAIKRILVPQNRYDEIAPFLISNVNSLTTGLPQDNPNITPVINSNSANYIEGLYNDAISNGATALNEFKREDNLISPVLMTNVTRNMNLYYEEPFGPIVPIITFETLEEAISIHNDSDFGLQASVYGRDITTLLNLSDKLDVASININGKTSRGPDNFSFSGFKQSGYGVQGIEDSILSMTKPKSIVINK